MAMNISHDSSSSFSSSESEEEIINVFDGLGNVSNPPEPKIVRAKDINNTENDGKRKRRRRGIVL